VQSGSTAASIVLAAADAAKFAAGSMIALDVDYTGQTGFVGAPVSGAYVRQALTDVDYVRRVTFNVALVSQVTRRAYACRAAAGRRSRGRRQVAGGHWICGSRRREFLSGVVGAVCDGRQPGGEDLLSLSAAADHGRRGRDGDSAERQGSKAGRRGCCSRGSFWRCR
jgi:hypothetical protein